MSFHYVAGYYDLTSVNRNRSKKITVYLSKRQAQVMFQICSKLGFREMRLNEGDERN